MLRWWKFHEVYNHVGWQNISERKKNWTKHCLKLAQTVIGYNECTFILVQQSNRPTQAYVSVPSREVLPCMKPIYHTIQRWKHALQKSTIYL